MLHRTLKSIQKGKGRLVGLVERSEATRFAAEATAKGCAANTFIQGWEIKATTSR